MLATKKTNLNIFIWIAYHGIIPLNPKIKVRVCDILYVFL
jgi:hypothetical protein